MTELIIPVQPQIVPSDAAVKNLENMAMISYVIQLVASFFPLLHFVSLIMALINQEQAKGTWLEGHFKYQIGTFLRALIFGILGVLLLVLLIGIPILIATWIWMLVRSILGISKLSAKQPI